MFAKPLQAVAIYLAVLVFPLAFAGTVQAQATPVAIELLAGWNLVALPVDPVDPAPSAVFQALENDGQFLSAWTYDAAGETWSRYPAAPAGLPELTEIRSGRAYWVRVTSVSTLVVDGVEASASQASSNLSVGWNLLGFTLDEAKSYESVLSGLDVREIWTYEAAAGRFDGVELVPGQPPVREDFTEIRPGQGYWLYLASASSFDAVLGTAMPGDIDVPPLLPDSEAPGQPVDWTDFSPGDQDFANDSCYDRPETQRAINFAEDVDTQLISIFNAGETGVLSYTARVVDPDGTPWLGFVDPEDPNGEPVESVAGVVASDTAQIELVADKTGYPPGTEVGAIIIESNGQPAAPTTPCAGASTEPVRTIAVTMNVAPLAGEYRLRAVIDTVDGEEADLHDPLLRLSLYKDAAGLKGIIDDEQTLLMPRRMRLVGDNYQADTNKFRLSGAFVLPVGHPDNPYQTSIRREITLIGDRATLADENLNPLDLKGEYRETIRNVLPGPIYLAGRFEAQRLQRFAETIDEASDPNAPPGVSAIPDEGTLTSTIVIDDRLLMTEVDVYVDITHTRPADLRVRLTSPAGQEVILRDQVAESLLDVTYDETETPEQPLDVLEGQFSDGTWVLTIDDLQAGEIGSLLSWDVNIRGTKVHSIEGTIESGEDGVELILTGCGQTIRVTTGAGGSYRFDDLIDCIYQIRIVEPGIQQQATEVVVDGADVTELSLATDASVSEGNPADAEAAPPVGTAFGFKAVSTSATAGLVSRVSIDVGSPLLGARLGGEDAFDSATFDIDRPPLNPDPAPVGDQDTEVFSESADPDTGTNALGSNSRIDPPVGTAAYRILVSIGQPIIGRSTEGNQALSIGFTR